MVEGTPPRDALPPPPQRATPARKGARCGAGAGSPRPHRPQPGHTGRGTLAARSRGRAAGGGTAPATRRPSQRWQATPLGDGPPPPPRHAVPQGICHGPAPRGAHSPKPGRGEPGPDTPPQSRPDGARDRGRTRGGAQTTWNGPTSAQCWDRARCARHTTQGGGGADAAGARAHTHTKGTRGLSEGQPDRAGVMERPCGMAYQRARVRDTRTGRPATPSAGHAGRAGGNGRDTTLRTDRNPPEPAASAAHTGTEHRTRQGSSGAPRHAPTSRPGGLRASPRGSHW